MSNRDTFIRSMHDIGLAAWFGGGLMGIFGLNGGTAEAKDPTERLRLSSIGWAKWAPVQFAAVAVHGIGGIALILTNRDRLAAQPDARSNTLIKTVITGAAGFSSVAAAIAGSRILKHSDEGAEGVTEPGAGSSTELKGAQRAEKYLQWAIPVFTGILLVLGAQQGEQQKVSPAQGEGWAKKAKGLLGR
jgi:hypothetical protein